MAIPKGKERITITIHKETKVLMDQIALLHDNPLTYSNLIEIALLFYAKACLAEQERLNAENKEEN